MRELNDHGQLGLAAVRSGMHRNTARRHRDLGKLPSESRIERTWRTRGDPFAADWDRISVRLAAAPELEAKALFEDLLERLPERYSAGQLRTFQRRVRQWRALEGPGKEVFFPQEHRPGEVLQTDFTDGSGLGVTIQDEPFAHLLCQSVLPYSNWQSVRVCLSESLLALQQGIETAVHRLGRVPKYHQTDHSTAATHRLKASEAAAQEKPRGFNQEYQALMDHLGMIPRTIAVGAANQNGDIESFQGVLKRRLEQHLLLRGNRDFESVTAYDTWITEKLDRVNQQRRAKIDEELAVMDPLRAKLLPEHRELRVRVTRNSTIRVKNNTYSVPSRLIGEILVVHVGETSLEASYGGRVHLRTQRLVGEGKSRIDYRHSIDSLVRKPGAFARYRHRPALFPSLTFRRAFDVLCEQSTSQRQAELAYLRILQVAATTMECEVEAALELLLTEKRALDFKEIRRMVACDTPPEIPSLPALVADLSLYDALCVSSEGRA